MSEDRIAGDTGQTPVKRRAGFPLGLQVTMAAASLLVLLMLSIAAAIFVVVGMKDNRAQLNGRELTYGGGGRRGRAQRQESRQRRARVPAQW